MRIPLLRGRTFETNDLRDDGAGVIISAALARTLFATIDVVGRRIELPDASSVPLTVVGVADDIRAATLSAPAALLVYLPSLGAARIAEGGNARIPFWPGEMTFVVRSALPPTALIPAVRAALAELDPTLPVAYPRQLEDLVAAASARPRMTAWLLLTGAIGALLLGVVGIYGVIAYTVRRRTPELALRMVFGASPGRVTAMVLRQGLTIALFGIAGGMLAALALSRLLRSMLYDVSPSDPRTFAVAAAAMLLIVVAASGVPARRAARTAPAEALGER
jgi:putative ABC transport system permease protein